MTIQEWLGNDNKLGIDIWTKKYQYNNETFDEWLDRVSGGDNDVKRIIKEKKFLFGGRILANRGLNIRGRKITYSNCYVVSPPEDNIESIFDCAKKLARTYSYGGGCGIDISNLAPRGAKVNNAAKKTTGSTSFMDLYSLVTGLIAAEGRRGALMISISCDHPDVEEFIDIKNDLNRVTKANISIRITDKFMVAVKNRQPFTMSFKREDTGEEIVKNVDAYSLFRKLCQNNWNMAEPGILYWDRIENWNLLSCDDNFHYAGTNPCAEEPLPSGGSCCLSSINLSEFVRRDKTFDFQEFREVVHIATVAMNDVLDEGLSLHPLQEQRDSVRDWRQIGIGIFGLADMLIKMGIKYGDSDSFDLCDMIGHAMADEAIRTSALLAKDYGAYPKYNSEAVLQSAWYSKNALGDTKKLVEKYGLHNSQLLTIAPTGSLSSMFGVSGGIEPIFANYYTRKTESLHGHDEYYKVYTPIVEKYMKENSIEDDADLPDFFITSQNLEYHNRIDMQSVWQSHIDASISSTVNLPNETTVEQIEDLYMYAWERHLKGITIYRDGCARGGILTTNKKMEKKKEVTSLARGVIIKADDDCIGKKRTLTTGCGSLHLTAFFDPATGDLLETYFSKGSSGGCALFTTGLSRMISLAARGGIDIYSIVDQLKSSGTCPSYAVRKATKHDTSKGSCCPVAIGYALLDMYEEFQNELFDKDLEEQEGNKQTTATQNQKTMKNKKMINPKCPECGEPLVFEGGCNTCKACGYTKCD